MSENEPYFLCDFESKREMLLKATKMQEKANKML